MVFRYTMQDRTHAEGFQERASGREEGLSKVAMTKGFGVKSRNLIGSRCWKKIFLNNGI